jgi:hypothetical protein
MFLYTIDKNFHGSSKIHVKSILNHIFKYVKCNLHIETSIVSYVIIKYL